MSWIDEMNKQVAQNQTALQNLSVANNGSKQNIFSRFKDKIASIDWDNVDLNGIVSGLTGVLNGGLGIGAASQQLADMHGDTSEYDTQMANLNAQLHATNETIDQALAMQSYPINKQTAQDIRGMDDNQRRAGIASATINGVQAGLQGFKLGIIPGLFTTIAGAGIGFLNGKQADVEGQRIAQSKADFANYNADMMMQNLQANREADINRIQLRNNAESTVHAVSNGGNIERKQMDIRSFANKALGKKDYPDRPVRRMTKGGVMVRFKVK